MLDYLTVDQLLEWEAHDRLDPIGEHRNDYRMAIIVSMMTNLVGSVYGKKGQFKPSQPADFMPKWFKEDEPEQSVDDMKKLLQGIAKAWKMKDKAPLDKPPIAIRRAQEKKTANGE